MSGSKERPPATCRAVPPCRSPFARSMPSAIAAPVRTTMVTSGEGMSVVSSGEEIDDGGGPAATMGVGVTQVDARELRHLGEEDQDREAR